MKYTFFLFTPIEEFSVITSTLENITYLNEKGIIEVLDPLMKISPSNCLQQRKVHMLQFFPSLMGQKHIEVQSQLLMQLINYKKSYKIQCESIPEITPLLNKLIENSKGIVYTLDMSFYTTDWQLVMNSNGECHIESEPLGNSISGFQPITPIKKSAIPRKNQA